MPTMERTGRPRDIDETVMEVLLDLLRDLLEIFVRVELDGVRFVEEGAVCRRFIPDDVLLTGAEGRFNIVGDQRDGAGLVLGRDSHRESAVPQGVASG